jgi:hypothetical protein
VLGGYLTQWTWRAIFWVFGFQQAAVWAWGNPATIACIACGAALLVVFDVVELRTESPLIVTTARCSTRRPRSWPPPRSWR